jgi:ubiquinone/menaquinone biosynthesis C-methylase UbiE
MHKNEIERIKMAYSQRELIVPPDRYSFFNTANCFMAQRREYEALEALKRHGINSLEDKKILDIGCGTGNELRNFIKYGALPQNLYGIDLISARIEKGRMISPNFNLICGDASKLPYEDETFDIIVQFTVFTSILDKAMQRNIASEIKRVLKSKGLILWCDYCFDSPGNNNVRGMRRKDIFELFPECTIELKRIMLAPPLVRLLAPFSVTCCYILEKIRLFNTYYLGIIRKRIF